jgi:hypothetical protein
MLYVTFQTIRERSGKRISRLRPRPRIASAETD